MTCSRADVIVITPCARPDKVMIGAAHPKRTRTGTYLINVSGGSIVRTDALLHALIDGRVAGAGLDVTDQSRCRSDHLLRQRSDVILTPQSAGQSPLGRQRVQVPLSRTCHDRLTGCRC
jgi:D-3-phosphoglycerate dehydrogenase